jgi:anti-sigma regulatory factor (Ser/Thr protein kinase)
MTTSTATIDLPTASAPPVAVRRVTSGLLSAWGLATTDVDDVVLVVHEIFINAVEHAAGEANLELQLTHADDRLWASVADGSSIHPIIQELDHRADRGRGMQLVAAICARWGVDDHHGGKRVWVQINLGRAADQLAEPMTR